MFLAGGGENNHIWHMLRPFSIIKSCCTGEKTYKSLIPPERRAITQIQTHPAFLSLLRWGREESFWRNSPGPQAHGKTEVESQDSRPAPFPFSTPYTTPIALQWVIGRGAARHHLSFHVSMPLFWSCSSAYAVHESPHIREIIWYLSFSDCFISLSIIISARKEEKGGTRKKKVTGLVKEQVHDPQT